MDFQNIAAERVGQLPFSHDNPPDDLYINIVLVEKGPASSLPMVYRCLHDDIHSFSHHPEEFHLLGEMVEIDKQKKQILLKTENTITYKFLVTVTAPTFLMGFEQQREFSAAVHNLIEALRMKETITPSQLSDASPHATELLHEMKRLAKGVEITPTSCLVNSSHSSHPGKCLYEFQF